MCPLFSGFGFTVESFFELGSQSTLPGHSSSPQFSVLLCRFAFCFGSSASRGLGMSARWTDELEAKLLGFWHAAKHGAMKD